MLNSAPALTTLGLLSASICTPLVQAQAESAPTARPDRATAVAAANNRFGADLYRALRGQQGNLFFSPYSISVALGMTHAGAAGATADEMARVLHARGLRPEDYYALREALQPRTVRDSQRGKVPVFQLKVANTLWGQTGVGFEDGFLTTMKDKFRAPLERIDFAQTEAARKRINDWVAQRTANRIQNIVPRGLPSADCTLALGNAIYFKAAWQDAFSSRRTKPAPFTLAGDKIIEVPMMNRTGYYGYTETEDAQVLELPYRDGDTSMVIVLPKQADGLAALEAKLDGGRLAALCSNLKHRAVDVRLPKFQFTQPQRLDDPLKKMGMRLPFTGQADFSKMTKAARLAIGAVLHKAFIAVDEKGTEAAAATVVLMKRGSARPRNPITFVADHPFLFTIRHRKTGCVLFMGRMANPEK